MIAEAMGQVLVRNLDDDTISAYKEAATRHDRSLEAELRDVLRTFRPLTDGERSAASSRMKVIQAMTPDVPQTPAEMLVREDRDGFRD